jgi:hypothetical protein
MRYVSCSITVRGFVMPPAQIFVQIWSTLFFTAPVIIVSSTMKQGSAGPFFDKTHASLPVFYYYFTGFKKENP